MLSIVVVDVHVCQFSTVATYVLIQESNAVPVFDHCAVYDGSLHSPGWLEAWAGER